MTSALQQRPPLLKILHVINGEYYAGAERVQDLLAKNLPDFGFQVDFACLKPDKFLKMRHYKKAPVHIVRMRFPFDLFRAFDLVKLIQKEKYVLIHTHYPRSDLIGGIVAFITKTPMVLHVHSQTMTDSENLFKNRINTIIERICMNQAQKVIVVSNKLLSTFPGKKILPKIQVIHNGVPTVDHLPHRHLNTSRPVIGVIAFWRPGKGLHVLFEALNCLKGNLDHFILRIVGGFVSADYKEKAENLARKYHLPDKIVWVGPTADIHNELNKMDILVMPSLNEGLPMVILEAMSSGVPIIASDVGGIPEAIRNGTDGLLVPPQEPGLLAKAICDLLTNENQWLKFRQNAYERQKTQFSDITMASKVAKTYRDLL